jgi:basic membrane lipoprotein Med (substrate-binding protein (PBP1-ABC) superfamily)
VGAMDATQKGTFKMAVAKYGLSTGVIRLADYYGLVPPNVAAEAKVLIDKIIAGTLRVPEITQPTKDNTILTKEDAKP